MWDEMGGACRTHWAMRSVYRILTGHPEGKRPVEKHKRRWEYNIKADLKEIGSGDVDCIHMALVTDRWQVFVNTIMNFWVQ
jgi:hypothetical protein